MVENLPDTGFKGQFRFLKTQAPWLILGATMLGNGGVFCWYSYISPLLTQVSGFSAESLTVLMVLAGFGMVAGNLISGRLSDKYMPGRVAAIAQGMICVALLLVFFLAQISCCGGLPLEVGLGYKYPALIGSGFAFIGFLLLTFFYRKYERTT